MNQVSHDIQTLGDAREMADTYHNPLYWLSLTGDRSYLRSDYGDEVCRGMLAGRDEVDENGDTLNTWEGYMEALRTSADYNQAWEDSNRALDAITDLPDETPLVHPLVQEAISAVSCLIGAIESLVPDEEDEDEENA